MSTMARHLVPSKHGGMTVSNATVKANREFDKKMNAGLLCAACARPFGPNVKRHVRKTDCCEQCGNDFE